MSARRQGAPITAHGLVPVGREAVFAFLAELGNHWLVADRWIEVVCLDDEGGGGRVRIRGPLGLRRTARTQVLTAQPPARLEGRATLGRTVALVQWGLTARGEATLVRLEAHLVRAGLLDRLLLAAGGRAWLRRRFQATIAGLGRHCAEANRRAETRPRAPREVWTARA